MKGKIYGNWKVLDHVTGQPGYWNCLCKCGKPKVVAGYSIRRGTSTSCGCIRGKMARERTIKPSGTSGFTHLYNNYKWHSKDRNLVFSLTKEEFKQLTSDLCHYCKIEPNKKTPSDKRMSEGAQINGQYIYNGVDRVDNTRGYTLDNCVPCCGICNKAKGILNYSEFMQWIQRLKRVSI